MSASDLAAVVAAVVALAAVAALTAVCLRALRSVRELESLVADVRAEALPALAEAEATIEAAGAQVARVDSILDAAEAISSRVDGASRAAYLALSKPVIKTAAAATGAQRAARRLRGRDEVERGRR